MPEDDTYYWAGGHQIPLSGSDDVVIDLGSAGGAGLNEAETRAINGRGQPVNGNYVLLRAADLPHRLTGTNERPRGIHPVLHAQDGSRIVVLPEVRVEDDDPKKLRDALRLLEESHKVEVITEKEHRLVVRPTSGRGTDALLLANQIAEQIAPDVAQARFLRLVDRPEVTGRSRA